MRRKSCPGMGLLRARELRACIRPHRLLSRPQLAVGHVKTNDIRSS
jgi:hypothetical protein